MKISKGQGLLEVNTTSPLSVLEGPDEVVIEASPDTNAPKATNAKSFFISLTLLLRI